MATPTKNHSPASSLAKVEAALESFVIQPDPGVIAVKGAWGAGKSYLWRHFIERQPTVVGCDSYAYCSLFGVSSLAELRRALFAKRKAFASNTVGTRAKRILGQATNKLARHVEVDLSALGVPSLKNTELLADAIEDRALREMVICLDDLERKEETITPSALLGFITNLRDERRCKVVLLYNEEKAAAMPGFGTALADYREKAIDLEILLKPTPADCYELIFGQHDYGLRSGTSVGNLFIDDSRSLLQIFEEMRLDNLRVMQRTRATLDYFAEHARAGHPNLWPSMARQVVKLCWLHLCHSGAFSLDAVVAGDLWSEIYGRTDGNEEADERFQALEPIRRIAYHSQPVDQIILHYLRAGYVDWGAGAKLLKQQDAEKKRAKLAARQQAIWSAVWDNFQSDEATTFARLEDFVTRHRRRMSVSEVFQVAQFLRKFDRGQSVEDTLQQKIGEFVRANQHVDPFFLDLEYLPSELRTILHAKLINTAVSRPIADVIVDVTASGGWNPSDLRFLRAYTEDDYHAWLVSEKRPRLLEKIKTFRARAGAEEGGNEIVGRLDAALHRMASRTKLDAFRIYATTGLARPVNPKQA